MAFGYLLEWECICAEQYSRLVDLIEWQFQVQRGDIVYDGDRTEGKLIVVDTWPSPAKFDEFYTGSLLPAIHDLGIKAPVVSAWEIPDPNPSGRGKRSSHEHFGPWKDVRSILKSAMGGKN